MRMTTNQLKYQSLQEDIRSHKAMEEETKRSNLAKERNSRVSNLVSAITNPLRVFKISR